MSYEYACVYKAYILSRTQDVFKPNQTQYRGEHNTIYMRKKGSTYH
jgi:hypothetical protein